MAYATIADVQQENQGRQTFTGSSSPNLTQVEDWLGQTGGEIDAILKQIGYDLPVPATATAALKFLENANALGAAYRVEKAAKTSDRVEEARLAWESAKQMLRDGEIDLDLTIATAREARHSTATPMFTMDGLRGGTADRYQDGDLGPLTGPIRDF